jgi:flagellar hook-associated protein 1 FlgK
MSLSINLSGMKAAQVALDVTGHNIANVNTPNFKRQVIELTPVAYNTSAKHIPSGAGVAVANIYNATNPILDKQYPKALSAKTEYGTLSNSVDALQKILNNPALDMTKAMQDVYNSFQDLANNPTDLSARQTALESAQVFIDKSVALMKELSTTKYSLTDNYKNSANSINSLVSNISKINGNISLTGGNPESSLKAQRDSLIIELSQLTSIEVSDDGKTIMTASGELLLTESSVHEIEAKDIKNITGGSIGGTNKFINTILNPVLEKLPEMVIEFAQEINKQAVQGYDLNGNTGSEIFSPTDNSLYDFKLATNDTKRLGASSVNNGVGDGTNAQKMSDLRNQLFNGQTMQGKYSSLMSSIDNNAKKYNEMESAHAHISDSIESQIQEVSGVNLDEEAVNLMKYQRLYQANAQAMKILDYVFGNLINTIE